MSSNSWMEVLPPTSPCFSSSSWFPGQRRSGSWTQEENKLFEDALAHIDGETPDRWEQVAAMIPGKSVRDIVCHYQDLEDDVSSIEAGRIPFPVYSCSPSLFRLDWANHHGYEGLRAAYCVAGGKRSGGRPDQERKKGVPWSEEEHKLFLLGLQKYGKGDWRNISRNLVISRTPTQVASHAQKYFIRLNSSRKDRRRSSIHDITFPTNPPPSPSPSPSPSRPSPLSVQSSSAAATGGVPDLFSHLVDWKLPTEAFNSSANCNHQFTQPPVPLDAMKLQAQNTLQDPAVGSCRSLFRMHPRG